MRMARRIGMVFLLVALAGPARVLAAGDISKFFGHYIGQTMKEGTADIDTRELNVAILPYNGGFTVEWSTTIHRPDGRTKAANFSINFRAAGRKGVFRSAMRMDTFGNEIPLDPLDGDPYVWAVIKDSLLTVHSLIIFEDGSFEVQSYMRTLTSDGMDLVFTRTRNGEKVKTVRAKLLRIDD